MSEPLLPGGITVLNYASNLAELAEVIASRAEGALVSITTPEQVVQTAACTERSVPERELPPYFEDLRHQLRRVELSLAKFESVLNRVDL
jgi:hypothetical protein